MAIYYIILKVDDVHTELWNGEKMRLLRKHLANKEPEKLEICRKCDLPYGVSYAGRSVTGKIIRFLKL